MKINKQNFETTTIKFKKNMELLKKQFPQFPGRTAMTDTLTYIYFLNIATGKGRLDNLYVSVTQVADGIGVSTCASSKSIRRLILHGLITKTKETTSRNFPNKFRINRYSESEQNLQRYEMKTESMNVFLKFASHPIFKHGKFGLNKNTLFIWALFYCTDKTISLFEIIEKSFARKQTTVKKLNILKEEQMLMQILEMYLKGKKYFKLSEVHKNLKK